MFYVLFYGMIPVEENKTQDKNDPFVLFYWILKQMVFFIQAVIHVWGGQIFTENPR